MTPGQFTDAPAQLLLLNQGQSVADVCRALEVSAPTYHRWQQLYGGM